MTEPFRLSKTPGANDHWHETGPGFDGTHYAYPIDEAKARDAVVEAAMHLVIWGVDDIDSIRDLQRAVYALEKVLPDA